MHRIAHLGGLAVHPDYRGRGVADQGARLLQAYLFDESRRPWVDVNGASADQIEAAVALCPSGALRTRRPGAAPVERRQGPEIRASADGPLLVSGGVRILDARGDVLYEGEKAALCRCGGSANKPFCDGSHKTNGFRG